MFSQGLPSLALLFNLSKIFLYRVYLDIAVPSQQLPRFLICDLHNDIKTMLYGKNKDRYNQTAFSAMAHLKSMLLRVHRPE